MINKKAVKILKEVGYGEEEASTIVSELVVNDLLDSDTVLVEYERYAWMVKKWVKRHNYGDGNIISVFERAVSWSNYDWEVVLGLKIDSKIQRNIFFTIRLLAEEEGI